MNTCEAIDAVGDWGIKLSSAWKSQARVCSKYCKESSAGTLCGIYSKMARIVVGFSKHASYSSATDATLAVVCQCPKCKELFWYHLNKDAVAAFVLNCPIWPEEQKKKFK